MSGGTEGDEYQSRRCAIGAETRRTRLAAAGRDTMCQRSRGGGQTCVPQIPHPPWWQRRAFNAGPFFNPIWPRMPSDRDESEQRFPRASLRTLIGPRRASSIEVEPPPKPQETGFAMRPRVAHHFLFLSSEGRLEEREQGEGIGRDVTGERDCGCSSAAASRHCISEVVYTHGIGIRAGFDVGIPKMLPIELIRIG
ncbi:hypothetical protein MRX96_027147 [Rhipicephalus microplus]